MKVWRNKKQYDYLQTIGQSHNLGEFTINYETTKPIPDPIKISNSRQIYDLILPKWPASIEYIETSIMIALNRANRYIGHTHISTGSRDQTLIDPAAVCQAALMSNATAVILCHNHPSRNLQPSEPDKNLTRRVKLALQTIGIQLIDHLIITPEAYYSFADDGNL